MNNTVDLEKLMEIGKDINGCKEDLSYAAKKLDNIYKNQKCLFDMMEEQQIKLEEHNNSGIVIDYKTFSEIINMLSYAIPYNICTKEFVDKLINKGIEYENSKSIEKIEKEITNEDIKENTNDYEKAINDIIEKTITAYVINSLMNI